MLMSTHKRDNVSMLLFRLIREIFQDSIVSAFKRVESADGVVTKERQIDRKMLSLLVVIDIPPRNVSSRCRAFTRQTHLSLWRFHASNIHTDFVIPNAYSFSFVEIHHILLFIFYVSALPSLI